MAANELKEYLRVMVNQVLSSSPGIPALDRFDSVAEGASSKFPEHVSFVKFHGGDPARVTFLLSRGFGEPSSFQVSAPFPYWGEYQPSLFGGL